VNAYEALRSGQAGPLADHVFPSDRPIITVCNAGRVSQTAAELLAQRGLDARSLAGGMKAWSLAWNTAVVLLRNPSIDVIQVRRTGKGCLSYIVASGGNAAIIDPSLPPEIYLDLARSHGWQVRHVIETHIHADHLSRAVSLADQAKAALLLPTQQRVRFPHTGIVDGHEIRIGGATIVARGTPGHTAESTSYVLNDLAVFTGDTLFTNGVGRPDLHADPAGARERARALFASLSHLATLRPELLVLPAHASEPIPFDGRAISTTIRDVTTWLSEWLVSETAFVERVVSRLPPTPPNFARIVDLNESGTSFVGDPTELEAGANRCAIS
jgi:glyoxylase-like metal-dependent hydrolase (beta-lactamase superfamily II)